MGSPILIQRPGNVLPGDRTSNVTVVSLGRVSRGEIVLIRPRRVAMPTPPAAGMPAGTPIEGPYLRFAFAREKKGLGEGAKVGIESALPRCEPLAARVAQKGDAFAVVQAAVAVSLTVAEDFPSYYEIDANANMPFRAPYDGSLDLVTSVPTGWAGDMYRFAGGEGWGAARHNFRQTRDCPPNATQDLFVPLGCYGFEVVHESAANPPTIQLMAEDTGKLGPPDTLQALASLAPATGFYTYGQVMSVCNARTVRVINPAAGGNVKLIFHLSIV